MSSRVNLWLLVDRINSLPKTYRDLARPREESPFLDEDLKFKILSAPTSTAHPPIKQHFPESFFSFDVPTKELKKIGSQESLHDKVQAAFTAKLSAYAALLQRKNFAIPEEVLYVLLPFLHGETLTTPMLNDIVAEVKVQMGTSARATTTTASSSDTATKSRKRAKRG